MDYIFYERTDDGTSEIARLEGGKFTGDSAKRIQKLLEEQGYPNKSPVRILHGIRLWAEEDKNSTSE